ncbi:FUSC family protein [Desulfovibrio sp.]|uniref:FUSC family protein n=1 Tax=Desulfovibrio sp. TaxID=885 RepID=UPI0025BC2785|nr:FUSC family protein [Desulfovibrio sp.]
MWYANVPSALSSVFFSRLSLLREGFLRGLPYLDLTTPRATYAMRSILAAWLALVVAYWLDLRAPYAAASSVLLVITPVQGAVIGKGVWRILGTLVGMLAAFILMSAFGQSPWLFLLGFGLWMGVCVVGMTLLRHFRAYGATLAGYTVGMAAYGAMQHPELTFDQVMGRGAAVLVGVVCLVCVSALFSTRSVRSRLEAQLRRLASATAGILTTDHPAVHNGEASATRALDAGRRNLILDVYGVDDLLALGKAESPDLAQRAATVRQTMVSLFAALVGGMPPPCEGSSSQKALREFKPVWERAWQQASQALELEQGLAGLERAIEILTDVRTQLLDMLSTTSLENGAEHAALMIAGDRLLEQLNDFVEALKGMQLLRCPQPTAAHVSVPFYRDKTAALQNGLRALLTVMLGGAFWIETGWTYGSLMLAGLASGCALLSTAPNPALGAIEFIKGTVFAIVMAFFCTFMVLPHVSGLPLLLVVLGLFWLPGVYATSMPRHTAAGATYLVAFTTLAATDNMMHYDFALFLNSSVAWILATFFTLLGFLIVLPRNRSRDVARLRLAIRDAALGTFKGKRTDAKVWQWSQQHRIAQLGALLRTQPEAMDRDIANALDSIHLGREVLRLRQWLRQASKDSALRRPLATAFRYMNRRAGEPQLAARHARRTARALSQLSLQESAARAEAQRLIVVLLDIAALLESRAEYFSQYAGGRANAQ